MLGRIITTQMYISDNNEISTTVKAQTKWSFITWL